MVLGTYVYLFSETENSHLPTILKSTQMRGPSWFQVPKMWLRDCPQTKAIWVLE